MLCYAVEQTFFCQFLNYKIKENRFEFKLLITSQNCAIHGDRSSWTIRHCSIKNQIIASAYCPALIETKHKRKCHSFTTEIDWKFILHHSQHHPTATTPLLLNALLYSRGAVFVHFNQNSFESNKKSKLNFVSFQSMQRDASIENYSATLQIFVTIFCNFKKYLTQITKIWLKSWDIEENPFKFGAMSFKIMLFFMVKQNTRFSLNVKIAQSCRNVRN